MFYRFLIELLAVINQNLVHRFAYLCSYGFSTISRALSRNHQVPLCPTHAMGLSFPNPIGLAAGFDHDGKLLHVSDSMGFGFVEVGTVNIDSRKETDDQALEVRRNIEKIPRGCKNAPRQQLWGISLGSLGKNLDENAVSDFTKGMEIFWSHADYFAINLSRPGSTARVLNPDLKNLRIFLDNIKQQHEKLHSVCGNYVPVVVKVAIDYINNDFIAGVLLTIRDSEFDGVIVAFEKWPGIEEIVEYLNACRKTTKLLPFIVVGGIRTVTDARQVLSAGASLVQMYTGLVHKGPLQTKKLISTFVLDSSKSGS